MVVSMGVLLVVANMCGMHVWSRSNLDGGQHGCADGGGQHVWHAWWSA